MKKRHSAEQIVVKLLDVKVLVEKWRRHYNRLRPHSLLGQASPGGRGDGAGSASPPVPSASRC